MIYIGLLTDAQKRAGLFITQDEDFIYLWQSNSGSPTVIGIYLYELARVKEIRDSADQWLSTSGNGTEGVRTR